MVILIGGGTLIEMPAINDMIVSELEHIRLSLGRKPKILFLPQASYESKPYVNSFSKEFSSRLKCKATFALWQKSEMDYNHIAEKFNQCDAVYIGGGKYDVLEKAFKEMNIKPLLIEFYNQGKLIVGNSAGAMILCKESISDYKMAYNKLDNYDIVKGYGIIDVKLCPHSNEKGRLDFLVKHNLTDYLKLAENEFIKID